MVSLKAYNTYHIDAYAEHVYSPKNIDEIIAVYQAHQRVIVLGNGSNIIFSKPHYDDVAFIVLGDNYSKIEVDGEYVTAQAGALLKDISLVAYDHALSGIETFFDVPASVGGAMIMNAGAYGDQIYDIVESVTVLNLERMQVESFSKSEINYGYRHTMFKEGGYCILEACFRFLPKDRLLIKDKMDNIYAQRLSKLPYEPSAGSVFKRPNYHITVGEMVEKIGLKGLTVGGAQISPKHGGIIINVGTATGKDVIHLIERIKAEVLEHYGVTLEPEQIII